MSVCRIAVQNSSYLSNVLGIKNGVHRQKLQLKALDVVLFGYRGVPPLSLLSSLCCLRWHISNEGCGLGHSARLAHDGLDRLQEAQVAIEE